MDSDDGTDILYAMSMKSRNAVIRQIDDKEKAANLMELLGYDEDVAGGLMAKELIKANLNWNILPVHRRDTHSGRECGQGFTPYTLWMIKKTC